MMSRRACHRPRPRDTMSMLTSMTRRRRSSRVVVSRVRMCLREMRARRRRGCLKRVPLLLPLQALSWCGRVHARDHGSLAVRLGMRIVLRVLAVGLGSLGEQQGLRALVAH